MASAGSWLSGVLVAVGWYIFFDGLLQATADCVLWNRQLADHCGYNTTHPRDHLKAPDGLTNGAYWAPGIIGFLGAIMLNLISLEAVTDGGSFDDGVQSKARCWVFFSLLMMFCSIGGAIWIIVVDLQLGDGYYHWGGLAVLIQNILIFLGGLLFRIVRRSGDHAV